MDAPPLRVACFWRSMGPHHAARMAALAVRPEVERLRVVERYASDPERRWRVDRDALRGSLDLFSWDDALRARDWDSFDAAIIPGWAERDFLDFARRLPRNCLRVVYSASNRHDHDREPWREWLKRRRVARFDAALAAGALAEAYLRDLGMPQERIARVGNAADHTPFVVARRDAANGEPRPEWMAMLPERYILQAGRLAPEKNIDGLLGATRLLLASGEFPSDWGVVFAGDGPMRGELERDVAEAPRGRVHFLGETPPERLAPLMARCAFLALPSWREPWGLVANEAMAAGRPVLMSLACGCAPELGLPGAAWLAGGTDPASLAEALARALRAADAERDAMGARAAEVVERVSPEAFAAATASALVRWSAAKSAAGGIP